jgi:2',3'-cyclic-nucleotide 2'-phosphodiesterase (5'-nucleotidase family)
MRNYLKLISLLLLTLVLSPESHATLIQILHTNDLHASVETFGAPADHEVEYGGWAQLKVVMDKLVADAKAKGIETIKLDAGDYTEGTSFYFSDHGAGVIHAFQNLGYDATAMGNHDWLMGADDMDSLYGNVPFPFPVLSANVKINSRLKNLTKQIIPTTQIVRDGIKFGIFGLSTDEDLYSWIPRVNSKKKDMQIVDYRDQVLADDGEAGTRIEPGIANKMIQKLREDNDVVIALTHIGYEEDKLLAANSQNLDLVVGGHSHTFLETATLVPDRDGNIVPVVQTGFNGKKIGRIILDVEKGKRPVLVSYELIPILNNAPKDTAIASQITVLNNARQDQFGNRLDEVIGTSDDRLISGDAGPTSFSKFAAAAMYDVASDDVDFSLDVGSFHGNTPQPAGNVTRLNLMEMYPRKFEENQNEGLYVYEAKIPGILVELGLKYVIKFGLYVEMTGVTYDMKKMSDKDFAKARGHYMGTPDANIMTQFFPDNIKVNGAPLKKFHWYTLAAPESLVRGALALSPLMKYIIRNAHPTEHTIWDAMNFHLLKIGKIQKVVVPDVEGPWGPGIHTPRSFSEEIVGAVADGLRNEKGTTVSTASPSPSVNPSPSVSPVPFVSPSPHQP